MHKGKDEIIVPKMSTAERVEELMQDGARRTVVQIAEALRTPRKTIAFIVRRLSVEDAGQGLHVVDKDSQALVYVYGPGKNLFDGKHNRRTVRRKPDSELGGRWPRNSWLRNLDPELYKAFHSMASVGQQQRAAGFGA
ncbi:Lrp/AsnC family transcriptional regulator [Burkholderia sp. SIMBA_057]